ncbi:beta-propeller fold lactonase family protein [Paraburkholderia sp. ZP32-5]|uniref:beta-propeller fold lactonase family protein n=1 Tax=Paraburkholderia sp. ZP32-5 TaxID=2883245 RepID=UPI001F400532|nr:beta-propeller fold lactonase family protein [Paraburkholderia sp. ZP32-5]
MSKRFIRAVIAVLSLGLAACHGGDTLNSTPVQNYLVAGNITGLSAGGAPITLVNNGQDKLTLDANGGFHFPTPLANGATYSITIATQPPGETCTVVNGTGTVSAGNVTSISVSCSAIPAQYTVGGNVAGLNSGASVTLKNNGSDIVTVSANGSFVFPASLVNAAAYDVTVATQPNGETCTASHALGTVDNANVANVSVVCTANAPTVYTVGGMLSGLGTGASVTLLDNGSDTKTVSANGAFTFPTALAGGASWNVTVGTQPVGETCTVNNASGTQIGANVTAVSVACSANPTYSIGGTVSGLRAGASVALQNNGADTQAVATNGSFVFATQLLGGASYNVTVSTQPVGETCTVTNGSNVVGAANVTSVNVTCVPAQFAYAVESANAIYGYAVDATTGALTPLAASPFPASGDPSNIAITPTGAFAYVTLSGNNTVAGFAIDAGTGALTPVAGGPVPAGADPHAIAITPSGKFVYVTNLNSNTVSGYSINASTGVLTPIGGATVPTGNSPYSIVVDPSGRFVYVGNYNDADVSGYTIDATTGALTPMAAPFPGGPNPFSIAVNPAGTLVYTANAGGGISGWSIDQTTGALTSTGLTAAGISSDAIQINPAGTVVYASDEFASGVNAYTIGSGGVLTAIAGSPFPSAPGADGIAISTSGKFIYVSSSGGGVYASSINTTTGVMTVIPGSPFAAAGNTQSVAITP